MTNKTTEPEPGDIWTTTHNGQARYIRITPSGPNPTHPDYHYVRDTNHNGTWLGRAKYLQASTLRYRYVLHYRPTKHYT